MQDFDTQFARCYDQHVRQVYGYCYIRLGSHEAAEDATQDAFRKALESYYPCEIRSFTAWILAIAEKIVIDFYRRSHSRPQTQPIDDAAMQVSSPIQGPEEMAIGNMRRERLREAIASLPHRQRLVITLDLDGFSGSQIAAILGAEQSAVRMLRLRAHKSLGHLMTQWR